jgi:hypothetical protein
MRGTHRHSHGDLCNRHSAETVRQRDPAERPLAAGLFHQFADLLVDRLAVGLVLEMSDTFATREYSRTVPRNRHAAPDRG